MWRVSRSWLERQAARVASSGHVTAPSLRVFDHRASAALVVGSIVGAATLGALLAQELHGSDGEVARMEGVGSVPQRRASELPLSKEHLRLARRFTRRNQQKFHRYVIVGCGTAAHAAIEAIRQSDPQADILILSDERALPRHESHRAAGSDDGGAGADAEPMSEALLETYNEWRRHIAQRLEEDPSDVPSPGASSSASPSGTSPAPVTLLMRKDTKMHFDVEKNRILLTDGTEIRYEKCLIACSGRPRHFYVLDSDKISYALKDRINLSTTLHDFEQLSAIHKRPDIKCITVVGGGFLGTEVATALATDPRNAHIKTQLTFVESAPASRSLPAYLAVELGKRLEAAGVEVIPDRLVTSIKSDGKSHGEDRVAIKALGNGKHKMVSDYVVLASTHTEPNLRLERQTCFEVDDRNGGIVVNAQLEAMAGVFVAGNAASYFDPYLGRRRVDRYDHAVNSGLLAGMNMVAATTATPFSPSGRMKLYRHQPMFRSNLNGIDVQIEGIGEIDASLHTVGVWVQKASRKPTTVHHHHRHGGSSGGAAATMTTTTTTSGDQLPPPTYDRGVVYYLKGNKIMGILLWNAGDVLESARQLLLSRPEVRDTAIDELKDVISLGPDDWLHVVAT